MPLTWNPALTSLITLLAGLYPDRDRARLAVRQAGLDPDEIDFSGVPKVFWMRVVEEANRRDKIRSLIDLGAKDFGHISFAPLVQQLGQPKSLAAELPPLDWKGSPSAAGTLEKIIGSQPTFLPISFLETGLLRSRSVARVETPRALGTGFLIRNNLLITNNHVLPSPNDARAARVWFNYQQTADGVDCKVTEFALDPGSGFATSSIDGGDDWTAVRLKTSAEASGHLDLSDSALKVNDYVNIIQHPSGMKKQIALYHNVVAYVDDSRVQYLTDTMPGSSGAPVFDSAWRVVALHHSGGWLTEPGTHKVFFRNEGIHVRALIKGLKSHGIFEVTAS